MQLYYITDRSAFAGDEETRRRQLLNKIAEAARSGVDYIQLREKDLCAAELERLACEVVDILREIRLETRSSKLETKLLINSRADIALSVGAVGIHLRSDDISPREIFAIQSLTASRRLLTAVSCHSVEDVRRADAEGATFAVLAPIFGKPGTQPLGLGPLKIACHGKLPVFALGGVTAENVEACREAGAQGIAGISIFQNNNIADVVRKLHTS